MKKAIVFNRMELSGSLGDLGTVLPLALGMILMNGMNPSSVFFCFGLYYIASGLYFRVTMPVEPMKIVAAYAIASGITASQIQSSSLLLALFLLFIGATGVITHVQRLIPTAVVRGVQLSTGSLLIGKGVKLMIGTSPFQMIHNAVEPFLAIQNIGPLPISLVMGIAFSLLTLYLLDNNTIPAAVTVFLIGLLIGILLHKAGGNGFGGLNLSLPPLIPYGFPALPDFSFALVVLVLPQIPMTIGNAVLANADLAKQYFPDTGERVTTKGLCLSMAFANLFTFFLGGIPMCSGAGGLASRYRFGARTAGSNIIIGGLFLSLVLLFGSHILQLLQYIPMAVLGVLLVFAGAQLSLTLLSIQTRKDMFVVIIILGITLSHNLATGFIVGIFLAHLLKFQKIRV